MDNLDKIYSEAAEELGISKKVVRSIAEAQFSLVAKTFKERLFDNVRLQYLGTFKVKPGRLQYLSDRSKDNIRKKTDEFNKFL